MASYATLSDVKARAGAIGDAWGPATTPSDAEITAFLANVGDEITALIEGHGLTAPAAGSDAAKALVSLNADGALVLAIEAAFPGEDGPSAPPKLYDRTVKRYEATMALLIQGKHPALTLLESGTEAPTASSFWADEPEYGLDPRRRAPLPDPRYPSETGDPARWPAFRRGQSG